MMYAINVKYWHDSHDHEIFFGERADARQVFKALLKVAVNCTNDIEFISFWEEDNLLECIHF